MVKYPPRSPDYTGDLLPPETLEVEKRPFLSQDDINSFFRQKKRLGWLLSLCDWLITSSYIADQNRWQGWVKNYSSGHHPTIGLLYTCLYLPGVYIHELAHYLADLLAGSWIGCYPIRFSVYHTDSGMGGSVLSQFENRPVSPAGKAIVNLLCLQAPTLVWLTLLCGSLTVTFPYSGLCFAWVLLFVPPQSGPDTHRVHGIVTGLLHAIPETCPLRARENSLPVWTRIKALAGLTYRVMGWPAFYLKYILTGIIFLFVPMLQPTAMSIQFSYHLQPISFYDERREQPGHPGKAYRQITSRTYVCRYERHKDIYLNYFFFWALFTRFCYLLAQVALWLVISGIAIVYAGRGNYVLLGYWALYGHFIAGRPGNTWSITRTVLLISRFLRRKRYQAEIDELTRTMGLKNLKQVSTPE